MRKLFLILTAVTALTCTQNAFGISVTGAIVNQVPAIAPDLSDGANEDPNGRATLYLEQANLLLAAPVNADNYGAAPTLIPAGTLVNVYVLHLDPVNTNIAIPNGTVTFDNLILGMITDFAGLINTDGSLGNPGTNYSFSFDRGPEAPDTATFAGTGLTINWQEQFGIDEIRIVVDAAVPEPGSLGLLSSGLIGVLALRRRRRSGARQE